jgi:hypothetical protein
MGSRRSPELNSQGKIKSEATPTHVTYAISYPDISVKHCAYGFSVAIFTKRAHFSTFSFGRSKIIHSVQKYKLNLKKRANTYTY